MVGRKYPINGSNNRNASVTVFLDDVLHEVKVHGGPQVTAKNKKVSAMAPPGECKPMEH